ncbi:helix-turn-helix domain-containing protein [Fervidibacillus albus]|uniref:Helix-turn-helix domain-containing protein n=1 Tax=Fervidibacillus albus TaxID=2980026 RepID=A0A9E8LV83_9BACI|nr:helix-turn-helix transcriptional regulator [Fervidibacillus albus]WAA10302.1 helix-turn-helix domain-containing protein [Fervidibacillus albus]
MLSDRLKMARKKRGLTQEQLAIMVKTTKATISNYENKYSTPSNEMLKDLADALSVTTDYLLGRSDDPRLTEDQQKDVDEEFQELKKIIESLPKEEQEKVKRMVLGYVKGYADSRKENK